MEKLLATSSSRRASRERAIQHAGNISLQPDYRWDYVPGRPSVADADQAIAPANSVQIKRGASITARTHCSMRRRRPARILRHTARHFAISDPRSPSEGSMSLFARMARGQAEADRICPYQRLRVRPATRGRGGRLLSRHGGDRQRIDGSSPMAAPPPPRASAGTGARQRGRGSRPSWKAGVSLNLPYRMERSGGWT